MNEQWKNAIITKVNIAVHVAPNTGKNIHKNRPYHGFVLNDTDSVKDYIFDDGQVLHTDENSLFYLPKGSSYRVEVLQDNGCYAINFDAEINDEPFCLKIKNSDSLKKNFKIACNEWRSKGSSYVASAMKALYEGIYLMQKEQAQSYMPNARHALISPAINTIEHNFTNSNLTISSLASLCGMSEVYFRKIFHHSFGISPKEYIIQKRMEYAKQLLELGEIEISNIAELCGYTEPCHFSREFKKRFGIPPKKHL